MITVNKRQHSMPKVIIDSRTLNLVRIGCACVLMGVFSTACADKSIPITWSPALSVDVHPLKNLSEIPAVMDGPWKNSDGQPRHFFVHNADGEKMKVNTCKSLFMADRRGMRMRSQEGEFIYRAWAVICFSLKALSSAAPATRTYVSDFSLSPKSVKALPVGMAFAISPSHFERMYSIQGKGGDLSDYLEHASITIKNRGTKPFGPQATITQGPQVQTISLLAKADFNHDGMEDLLMRTKGTITGGHYYTFGLYVVTRTSPNGPLEMIMDFHVMGPTVSHKYTRVPKER